MNWSTKDKRYKEVQKMTDRYKGKLTWTSILLEVMGSEAYTRLCDCVSRKSDIPLLAKCYKRYKNMDSETALVTALEHMGENSQIFDYSEDDYNRWLKSVEKFQ